ncbi:MAG: hypothetical protein ACLGXA_21135 [Acidobacteriota bacterium]
MKRLLLALLFCLGSASAQTWSTWNGVAVSPATGNVSSMNGVTVGTIAGNYGSWNGLASPTSYPTYTDSFARADGSLGSNWTEPSSAEGGLLISSDAVIVQTPASTGHQFEIYSAGTFGVNQFTKFTIEGSAGTSPSYSLGYVRATATGADYYNDAINSNSQQLGVHTSSGYADFYTSGQAPTYAVGDTHELDVAGTGPTFFWMKRNGTIIDGAVDNTYNFNTGIPGLGFIDQNAAPTLAANNWEGGTLPAFSTTPTDDFQRADDGWLGVNWWFSFYSGYAAGYVLTGNAAVQAAATSGAWDLACWTTPLTVNQSSKITIGGSGSGDWIGVFVRYDPTQGASDNYYSVLINNGEVFLYVRQNGNFSQLSDLGPHTVSPGDTLELDATGTNPVVLTVKINGSQIGTTYNDTTYLIAGTYAGFQSYGSTSNKVTGWTGLDL